MSYNGDNNWNSHYQHSDSSWSQYPYTGNVPNGTHNVQYQSNYSDSTQYGQQAYPQQPSHGYHVSQTHTDPHHYPTPAYPSSTHSHASQHGSYFPTEATYDTQQFSYGNQVMYNGSAYPTSDSMGSGQRSPPGSPKHCSNCRAVDSPLWRRHPATNERLCNACGLYIQSHQSDRPQQLIVQAQSSGSDAAVRSCSHCGTVKTGSWRRGSAGELLCNACGVYKKLKGKERPIELANDPLRKRGSRK